MRSQAQARLLPMILLSILLTACGGGGGSGGGSDGSFSGNSPATVTISWMAPTAREDGTPLPRAEISGYEVYYFRDGSTEEEDEIIAINDPNTLQTQTPPLTAGTYYFAMVTIDTLGIYSDISDYVSININ